MNLKKIVNNKQHIIWLDQLRALATVSVIILHISSPILFTFEKSSNLQDWWSGNFFNSITRFCVPVFLMLTGSLLLSNKQNIFEFYKKRLFKVVLPFLFWSFIYILYKFITQYDSLITLGVKAIIKLIFSLIVAGSETSFHLWYLYMLVGIYLVIPIIRKWAQVSTQKELLLFISIWLFTIFINFSLIRKFNFQIELRYFSGYLGYVVLGYYLFLLKKSKKFLYLSICLIVVGFLSTFFGTYILSALQNKFDHTLYEYLSINVILLATGIYLFFNNINIENSFFNNLCGIISKYSFSIYLIHILVLNIFSQFGLDWHIFNPLISVPFVAFLCLSISIILIFLLKKIPYLNLYVG